MVDSGGFDCRDGFGKRFLMVLEMRRRVVGIFVRPCGASARRPLDGRSSRAQSRRYLVVGRGESVGQPILDLSTVPA